MDSSNLAKLLERKAELDAVLTRFEIWLLFFGVLVVIGVGGESFFGIRTWWNNRKLQEINRQLDQYRQAEVAEINRKTAEAEARAEGFQSSIAEANKQAEQAKEGAAQANLELAKLKSPRSLIHVPELIAALQTFNGTEYTFSSVFQNPESINFLKLLDSVLQQAGWKRQKPTHGFPAINVFGPDVDFPVPVSLATDIQISVDSSESIGALNLIPLDKLPAVVQAAVALDMNLSSSLSPPQKKGVPPVNVQPGNSPVIRIAIGQKPNE